MATPEQDAFIYEMMHKKPGEVWQELWDLRLALQGVGTAEVVDDGIIWKYPDWTDHELNSNMPLFGSKDEEDNEPVAELTPHEARVFLNIPHKPIEYPDGDWLPLPVEMYDQAMEYMKTDRGIVYIRAIDPGLTVARSGFPDPTVKRGGPTFINPHYND
jgi:hypothetical protein